MLSVIILTVLPSWEHVLALYLEQNNIQNNDIQQNNTECHYIDCLVILHALGLDLGHNNIQNNDTQHNSSECCNEPNMLSFIILTVLPS